LVLPPWTTVLEAGAAEIVKSGAGAAFTTSCTAAVRVSEPLVPATVSVALPVGVLADVVTVNVELPAPASIAGLKDAVAFAGRPLADRFTEPAKPFTAPTVTV
jgi:hypothetical protein